MTRQEIETALQDINQLVTGGQLLEAFDKYYHDDVIMQENEAAPTVSKAENLKREQQFLSDVTEFRGAAMKEIAVGDDVSFTVWQYDYTHKEWGVRNYQQVSIQWWKDGKIIKEQFIYSN